MATYLDYLVATNSLTATCNNLRNLEEQGRTNSVLYWTEQKAKKVLEQKIKNLKKILRL
jgi:hypothetical protein